MAGCSSIFPPAQPDTTRYFVLTSEKIPVAPGSEKSATPHNGGVKWQLGLRPVELPAYLRATKSLVVRSAANEIRYLDDARWAEPLEAGVNRVVAERLLAAPSVSGVTAHPMRGDLRRDCDITVRLIRCEGVTGAKKSVHFTAAYDLVATDGGGRLLLRKTFEAEVTSWDGQDAGALARQLSDAVTALADRIAADLWAEQNKTPNPAE